MSKVLGFSVFDADNHMYETEARVYEVPPGPVPRCDRLRGCKGTQEDCGAGADFGVHPESHVRDRGPAGREEEYFRRGNPEGKSRREIFGEPMRSIPAFREPAPRLELMDEQGVDRSLMFPTLASVLEERMKEDPELTHAVIHALNEWMYEIWQFNFRDRIFATPVITLPIVERAIEELEWVAARGARAVLIRPAPVPGYRGPRSFALPEFDPFWEKVVEHDILVALHSSDSGYTRYANEWMGSDREHLPFQPQAFRLLSSWRPIEDSGLVAGVPRDAFTLSILEGSGGGERFELGRAAAEANGRRV